MVGLATLEDAVSDHQYGVTHGGLLGTTSAFQMGMANCGITTFGVSCGTRRLRTIGL